MIHYKTWYIKILIYLLMLSFIVNQKTLKKTYSYGKGGEKKFSKKTGVKLVECNVRYDMIHFMIWYVIILFYLLVPSLLWIRKKLIMWYDKIHYKTWYVLILFYLVIFSFASCFAKIINVNQFFLLLVRSQFLLSYLFILLGHQVRLQKPLQVTTWQLQLKRINEGEKESRCLFWLFIFYFNFVDNI